MLNYNKQDVRDCMTEDDIFELFEDLGGEPEKTDFGLISTTICHNMPREGSRKLWFYFNTGLCRCYTGCDEPLFDIFDLVRKARKIQFNEDMDLNAAVRYVAARIGFQGTESEDPALQLDDWKFLNNYERIEELNPFRSKIELKDYDKRILNSFNYKVKIQPWLDDNISQDILKANQIGYYAGKSQITIPHFDVENRLIGIRGRTLIQEEGERYGKYRPLKLNDTLYNHPLGLNLYNLNNSKKNISLMKKAIIVESEKSCLQYQTMFGRDVDITVACCGSNISSFQIQLLLELGVEEIVIGFDRQFQKIGDKEFIQLKKHLLKLNDKFSKDVIISFIFDKNKITKYKSSPTDEGKEKFLKLYNERIII